MPGRASAKFLATAATIVIATSGGCFAAGAWSDSPGNSTDALYRDVAEFEGVPRASRPYGALRRQPTAVLAQTPGSGEAAPETPRQPDKPPDAVPRYKDGVYLFNKDYWIGYPLNLWRFFSAPARFDGTDWLLAAAAGGTAGLLIAFDDDIRNFWQDNVTGGTSRDVFDVFNLFGDGKFQIPTILGGYVLAELTDQSGLMDTKRGKSAFILAAQSAILTQLLVGGLKYITGRERPEASDDQTDFKGPGHGFNKAFPSGHASAAFALAGTISEVYQDDQPWVPWVLYPVATGTALARVDRDKHWASDVFVGGLIGYLMAATVVKYSPFLEENNVSIRPMNIEGSGVSFVKRF